MLISLFTQSPAGNDYEIEIVNKMFIKIHLFPVYYYEKKCRENLYMSRKTPCVKGRFWLIFESLIGMLLLRNSNDEFHDKVHSLLMKTLPNHSKKVVQPNILSFFIDYEEDDTSDFESESRVPPILQGVMNYFYTFIQINCLLWKNDADTLEREVRLYLYSYYFVICHI